MSAGPWISAFSDDIATDPELAVRRGAELGATGLAIRNVWGRNVADLDAGEVRGVARLLGEAGLRASSVGAQIGRGWFLDEEGGGARAGETLRRVAPHAGTLGTARIRVFAPWLRGHDAYELWSDRPEESVVLGPVVDALAPLAQLAESLGVTLALETEGASHVGHAREARLVIEAIGSPALTLCWDPANAWRSGEEPSAGLAEALRVPLSDVHTKDLFPRSTPAGGRAFEKAPTGTGGVGYPAILRALIGAGYDGPVTVERNHHPHAPERDPHRMGDTLADLRNLVALLSDSTEGTP